MRGENAAGRRSGGIMTVFPDTAPALLGFDAVRARLATHALGREAADRLAALGPFTNADAARREIARVAALAEVLRFDDPLPFERMPDLRSVLRRVAPEGGTAAPEDLLAVRMALDTARRMRAYLDVRRARHPDLAPLADALTPLPDVEARLARTISDEGTVRDDASDALRRLRRDLVRLRQSHRDAVVGELKRAAALGIAAADEPTVRAGRLVIALKAEARRKIPGVVHDVSATGQTVFLEPAAVFDAANDVREAELAEAREVERVLAEASAAVRARLPEIKDSHRALVALDVVRAKARLAVELDAVPAEMGDEGIVDLRAARHPALVLRFAAEAERGGHAQPGGASASHTLTTSPPHHPARAVVPLTLRLDGETRGLVITGPNAGGKSVALKTVGLFALMQAAGLLLPAAPGTRVDAFARLYADIGDAQNLDDDLSTFSSHVARLRHIVSGERRGDPGAAMRGALVLLDEAGTGTDPAEGGPLAQSVVERIVAGDGRVVATTHVGALKAFAHAHPHVANGAMVFDRETLAPTYRFAAGIPGSSYAFEIAERGGLDASVIARARSLAGERQGSLEDLLLDVQARVATLDRERADLATASAEAARIRTDFEHRRGELRRQRDALRAEALADAARIVREANAAVERTVREIKEAQAEPEATKAAREALAAVRASVERRQQKTERRQTAQARGPASGATSGPVQAASKATPAPAFATGDQVIVDEGTTVGTVMSVEKGEAVVAAGAFRMRVALGRLRRVGGKKAQEIEVRRTASASMPILSASTRLDVRGLRADEALADLPRFLDSAVAAGVGAVDILHGKGTGALRATIRDWLAGEPDVLGVEDARPEAGGAGVTVVTLR